MAIFTAGTLRLKAQHNGEEWSFVAERVPSQEVGEMVRLALADALPKLGFDLPDGVTPNSSAKLAVPVIAPVRRYWNGATLDHAEVLDEDARIEVRTTAEPADVAWLQDGFSAAQRVVVGAEAASIVHDDGVIARRSSKPAIGLDFSTPSWSEAHGELAIEGALRFENLPGFPPDTGGTVTIEGNSDTFPVTFDATASRFRTTIRLGNERPRSIRLRITWDAQFEGAPLTSEDELVMPVAFDDAEFLTPEGGFAACIFLGLAPDLVRFVKYGYIPDEIVLSFTFYSHVWVCPARHQSEAAHPAVYKIDWGGEALNTFRRAAPGRIFMTVEGESQSPRNISLLPGLVRGTWTNRNGRAEFRLAPAGINEQLIRGFVAAETGETVPVTVTPDGYVVPAPGKEIRCVSHVVFEDGATIPLDPGAFKPLYLDDPSVFGKAAKKRVILNGAETNAPPAAATQLRGTTASLLGDDVTVSTVPLTLLQSLGGAPVILQFGDAAYQLLIHRTGAPKFGKPLEPGNVTETAGLYFRGFHFKVRLIDADGPFAPGGKMLLLDPLLSLSFTSMSNHLLAFSPLRAVVDSKKGVVRILAGGRQIDLAMNGAGVITRAEPAAAFARLGYVYGSASDAIWSPVPAVPAEEPWLYTFDNLGFAVTGDDVVTFAGWFLPGGPVIFPAQAPFQSYSFNLSGSEIMASALLDPLPLRIRAWEQKLAVPDAMFAEFEKNVAEGLGRIGGLSGAHQQISRESFSVETSDGRQYALAIQLDRDSKSLRLVVTPPETSPAVRFFSLT